MLLLPCCLPATETCKVTSSKSTAKRTKKGVALPLRERAPRAGNVWESVLAWEGVRFPAEMALPMSFGSEGSGLILAGQLLKTWPSQVNKT